MSHAEDLKHLLESLEHYPRVTVLRDLADVLADELPPDATFDSDIWNVVQWGQRKGNTSEFNIYFDDIKNLELKNLAKIFVLHKRRTDHISHRAAKAYTSAISLLDSYRWRKKNPVLTNADFLAAEEQIRKTTTHSHAEKIRGVMTVFAMWLNRCIGITIDYQPKIKEVYKHGRKARDKGRADKLLPNEVVKDIISAAGREDLSDRDRFFLAAITIMVATGFRINELATLPINCLLEGNELGIKYFAAKFGKRGLRPFSRDILPMVKASIEHISRITEPGREAARLLRQNPRLDWSKICKDKTAFTYFVKKFAHEWTADPRNRMINPDGAWLAKESRFVDVIGLIEKEGSKSAAARALGVTRATIDGLHAAQLNSKEGKLPPVIATRGKETRVLWDTDTRVISASTFQIIHKNVKSDNYSALQKIMATAQKMQLQGEIYPTPLLNPKIEEMYLRRIRPTISTKSGIPILEPEDSLFIAPRYIFSGVRKAKNNEFRLITDKDISRWLAGEHRAAGTGNPEDSACNRLGILDPRTGEPAKFTSHDIRHWLNTTYARGKMPDQMISLVFGRKAKSNHTYDQTPMIERIEGVRDAIRKGKWQSHLSENYNRLAEYSREDAEQYLAATTLMIHVLPHGVCALPFGMDACVNYLSCFTGEDDSGPCTYLQIDLDDKAQYQEIRRLSRDVDATLSMLPEGIPQHSHLIRIKANLAKLINQASADDYSVTGGDCHAA